MVPSAGQLEQLQHTLRGDLSLFAPELALVAGIVLLLLARLVRGLDRIHLAPSAAVIVGVAFALAGYQVAEARQTPQGANPVVMFAGMLVSDPFSLYARAVILLAALLTVLLTILTRIPDREDSADLYTLLLGATLGMLLMTRANHLLMVFIAVEMASLPSYALAGFLKGRRTGSEASLKYVVYGSAASGVMLYGISLLAGLNGTGLLPVVTHDVAASLRPGRGFDVAMAAGFVFLFVGLGFKLAAVPFHFWCPDVFEGATAEVAGFLSVASKAAAVVLTTRILLLLHGPQEVIGVAVGVIAALTATFGNLAAFGQTNLKRMLAYSTIAHAGTMLLALATLRRDGATAVLFYLAVYVLMNLGAFAVVALVRNRTRSENLDAYRGLMARSPVLAVVFTIFLLSLLGLPPLAGFAGKFQVFAALWSTSRSASVNLGAFYILLLGIGALNTAMSAYYYLRVVRTMILDEPDADAQAWTEPPGATVYLLVLALGLLALGLVWNPLTDLTTWAVSP